MKAIVVREFGKPQVMKLEEVEDLKPQKDQVVVTIRAAGVNPVDTYCRSGAASWVSLPFTPGFDGAGIVKSIGSDVKKLKVGDRVYTAFNISGTYAEEVLCESSQVYPLPDDVSFDEGAGLYIPYGTAYRGLIQRSKIEPGESILIHGASGAVGIAATQIAVAAGCQVIGTAGTEEGRKVVSEQGAHYVADHSDDGHFEEILEYTNGEGFDVIIEMVSANVKRDMSILAKNGRIAVIGDRTPIKIDAEALTSRDGTILGTNIGNLPSSTMKGLHAFLYQGLHNRTLKPLINKKFSLAEADKAHEFLLNSKSFGKIVLNPYKAAQKGISS